jgi:hypothetical protein
VTRDRGAGPITSAGCVAGYGQISSDEDGKGDGVDNQQVWFERWAAEHHPGIPTRWFFDKDISGQRRGNDRALSAAMDDAPQE